MTNIFCDLPAALPNELLQTLLTTPSVRIERIVSLGQASPAGLRSPVAYTRWLPVRGSISQIAARPSSFSMPFSAALLFEPTPTYKCDPSGLAIRLFVQW